MRRRVRRHVVTLGHDDDDHHHHGRPPQTGSKVGISHFALHVKRSIFLGSCV